MTSLLSVLQAGIYEVILGQRQQALGQTSGRWLVCEQPFSFLCFHLSLQSGINL